MSKGSWQRPFDDGAWASNFDRIFGKKAKEFTVTVPDALPPQETPEPSETAGDQP
jgi:hypothetical protein